MAHIRGLDHVNIDTTDPDATVAFYSDILGFECRDKTHPGSRPGVWMWLEDQPLVHLNFHQPEPDSLAGTSPVASGAAGFNHVAFAASDADAWRARLEANGVEHREQSRPGLTQFFLTDPNGVAIELNVSG